MSVPISAGSPATFQDVRWQQLADELPFETLPRIRSLAAKWAATIGSITGVFAIVALIKGPEEIGALGSPERYWVIGLVGLAVASAVGAMLWAAHAAQGSAGEMLITGPELRVAHAEQARSGARAIFASKCLTTAAVAMLGLAIGLTWLSTPASPAKSSVVVASAGAEPFCGTVTGLTADGVTVQPDEGAAVVVAAGSNVLVFPVAACP
jgi:hypothetical protein